MLFPAEAVEACLRGALAAAATDQAAIRAAAGKENDNVGSAGWEPEVDSLIVLEALTALEEQFGIELPDDVVPPGGYADSEACVRHLLQRARAAWKEKYGEAVT